MSSFAGDHVIHTRRTNFASTGTAFMQRTQWSQCRTVAGKHLGQCLPETNQKSVNRRFTCAIIPQPEGVTRFERRISRRLSEALNRHATEIIEFLMTAFPGSIETIPTFSNRAHTSRLLKNFCKRRWWFYPKTNSNFLRSAKSRSCISTGKPRSTSDVTPCP